VKSSPTADSPRNLPRARYAAGDVSPGPTSARLALQRGGPRKISRQLRHASMAVKAEVSRHLEPEAGREVAAAWQATLIAAGCNSRRRPRLPPRHSSSECQREISPISLCAGRPLRRSARGSREGRARRAGVRWSGPERLPARARDAGGGRCATGLLPRGAGRGGDRGGVPYGEDPGGSRGARPDWGQGGAVRGHPPLPLGERTPSLDDTRVEYREARRRGWWPAPTRGTSTAPSAPPASWGTTSTCSSTAPSRSKGEVPLLRGLPKGRETFAVDG
jgi:hypothetical protein